MTTPAEPPAVVIEASCRSLASTILMASSLLEHDDIDAQQHPAIRDAMHRAAVQLAHKVQDAPDLDVRALHEVG